MKTIEKEENDHELKLTKRAFKEMCFFHQYGYGKRKHNAIFFDWKKTDTGEGFKYGIAVSIENATKKELFDEAYNWFVNEKQPVWYFRYKYAVNDERRFKTPIALNF